MQLLQIGSRSNDVLKLQQLLNRGLSPSPRLVEDGVFDRPGQISQGRETIRAAIAARPAEVWTRHYCSNIRIDLASDGLSASGQSYLLLFRGRHGSADHEIVRAEYRDTFALTASGWRIQSRKVAVLP